MKRHTFFALVLFFIASMSFAASFDCNQASNLTERTVCGNPTLSQLDDELGAAYAKSRSESANPDQLKQAQLLWIRSVLSCNGNESCMIAQYRKRIAELDQAPKTATNTITPPIEAAASQPSQEANQPIVNSPPQANKNSQPNTDTNSVDEDALYLGFFAWIVLTVLFTIVANVTARLKVRSGVGNRFVRNFSFFALLLAPLYLAISIVLFVNCLPDEKSGLNTAGLSFSLLFLVLSLMSARATAVESAGLAYCVFHGIVNSISPKRDRGFTKA